MEGDYFRVIYLGGHCLCYMDSLGMGNVSSIHVVSHTVDGILGV